MQRPFLTPRTGAVFLLSGLLSVGAATSSEAGSATWQPSPPSNIWSNPANWMPQVVPNANTDVATFGVSNTEAISLVESIQLAGLVYGSGASPYAITVPAGDTLTISGLGITNNSGLTQEFLLDKGQAQGGVIQFLNSSSAGALVHFEIKPTDHQAQRSPVVEFYNSASAGSATYDLEGALFKGPDTGHVTFHDFATAGSGTFNVHRGTGDGYSADMILFDNSTAGASTIICEASASKNNSGGVIFFEGSSSAGTATITANGGEIPGALLAAILFTSNSTASGATLIANGGVGQGGAIRFAGTTTGGTCRITTTGNGYIDITQLNPISSVTIGSLEGEAKGAALLGSKNLTIGSNGLSTTYSGVIQDGGLGGGTGGSLTKVGTGTLTLNGGNTFTGGTTVTLGNLVIANRKGSGSGNGPVQVNGGSLGGPGVVAGPLTIGSSSGSAATLMPELGGSRETTFTTQSALTFNSGATYSYLGNSSRGAADRVVANGVTINSGARFLFRLKGHGTLAPGTIFTALANTSANPIAGTFVNLADGSTLSAGGINFAVSYEGGDGNDLTLTVQ